VADQVGRRKIAFICARESLKEPRLGPELKKIFGGVFIGNQDFTKEDAERVLARGEADAVAWGKLFIANPDLPERLAKNAPLNAPNPDTLYASGPEGYIDYPPLNGTT
jgi:2,4-dienoyl-CoA reductase-like NADH-dependent reductase (Old Yellow Enzyme family)